MANVPLREVVATAARGLEEGDLALARAACKHIVTHFPHFADAHRLSGEVALESGSVEEARTAFDKVLHYDARNVLAALGLGVIAEENGDLQSAAAHFQQALENDPGLTQLRDELVRLYSQIYGQGGRLHPSGAGLAAIYARGNQLSLARQQYEELVETHPERLDLVLALAEMRWRCGDSAGAQQLCQQVLAVRPQCVRPLYIQADLFHRHGATERAHETIATAAAVDPLYDLARTLVEQNPSSTLLQLLGDEPMVDEFVMVEETPPQPAVMTNSLLGVTPPPVEENEWRQITSELSANPLRPPTPIGGFEAEPPPANPLADLVASDTEATPEPSVSASSVDWPAAQWDNSVEDLEAARPDARPAAGYTDILREMDALGMVPVDLEAFGDEPDSQPEVNAAQPPAPVAPAIPAAVPPPPPPVQEEPADPAAALRELVGNWDAIDQELAAATPMGHSAGYDDLVAELDQSGLAPFELDTMAGADHIADASESSSVFDQEPAALAQSAPDVTATDDGFLAELEESGLQPFSLDHLDAELDRLQFGVEAAEAPHDQSTADAPALSAPDPGWSTLDAELEGSVFDTTTLAKGGAPDQPEWLAHPFGVDELAPDGPPPTEPAPMNSYAENMESALGLTPVTPSTSPSDMPAPAEEMVPLTPEPAPVAAAATPAQAETEEQHLVVEAPRPRPETDEALAAPELASPWRPAGSGQTISLSGSLFDQLEERKQALVRQGLLSVRPRAIAKNGSASSVAAAEELVSSMPADPQARLSLAQAYLDSGQLAEAVQCFRLLLREGNDILRQVASLIERLAEKHHGDPRVSRLVGDLYMRQGRYSRALTVYRSLVAPAEAH